VLSDPTRVRVLELLEAHGELSVGALVERLGESQSNVSNHLACLRWCGFVERERRHPNVFYASPTCGCWSSWCWAGRCWPTTPSTSRRAGAWTRRAADRRYELERPDPA
jgi:DNA-binding transcriptional ArsR family regulator